MSARSEVQLTVIIPVYGNWTDTVATLESLAVQSCGKFRVILADDGSPSEAPAEIHGFGFVEYSKGSNLGFAGNCNRAAGMAIAAGATHLGRMLIACLNDCRASSPRWGPFGSSSRTSGFRRRHARPVEALGTTATFAKDWAGSRKPRSAPTEKANDLTRRRR